MKRHLILGAGLIATMMFMASCSNETEEEMANLTRTTDTQKEELEKLRMSIIRLNEQWEHKQWPLSTRLNTNTPPDVGTAIAKKSKRIVEADLAGASIGAKFGPWWALGVGAAASAIAFAESFSNSTVTITPLKLQSTTEQLVYAQDGQTPTRMDSIGYYHNLILRKIGTNKLVNAGFDSIEQMVEKSMEEIFGVEAKCITAAGLKSNEGYKFMKSHIAKLNDTRNVTAFCNVLSEYNSINQDELGVLKQYMLGLESNDNANGEYTVEVLNAVNSSKLDSATKERIRAGVIVGNASQKLWIAK